MGQGKGSLLRRLDGHGAPRKPLSFDFRDGKSAGLTPEQDFPVTHLELCINEALGRGLKSGWLNATRQFDSCCVGNERKTLKIHLTRAAKKHRPTPAPFGEWPFPPLIRSSASATS